MDIVTQMQDQVNHIASLFFNHVGTLQRDAPPAPLAKKAKHEHAREVSLMLEVEYGVLFRKKSIMEGCTN
jgi:hypothetical protein